MFTLSNVGNRYRVIGTTVTIFNSLGDGRGKTGFTLLLQLS
jgi:hypothetical protein